ncbi:MAG TPA: hypothetical protein VM238_18470 [Phycisphaerae bacterium]|nr:hypothetical protein [Phycisphaerae bacterium]
MTRLPALPKLKLPKLPKLAAMAKTAYAGADRRKGPRLSIDEINRMGMEELKKHPTLRSKKKWWDYPLDLLDLPRNLVAQAVGEVAGVKRAKKPKDVFGLPKVYMSDVLEKVGVKNKIAKAVAGFVGDVAIDPLTYLAGGSTKFASLGGTAVKKAAMLGIDDAVRAALKTGTVKTLGRYSALANVGARSMKKAAALAAKDPKKAGQLATKLVENIKGNLLRQVAKKGAAGDAARSFFTEFARKGAPILHMPFTAAEITLPLGRAARFQKAISGIGITAAEGARIERQIRTVERGLKAATQVTTVGPEKLLAHQARSTALRKEIRALSQEVNARVRGIKRLGKFRQSIEGKTAKASALRTALGESLTKLDDWTRRLERANELVGKAMPPVRVPEQVVLPGVISAEKKALSAMTRAIRPEVTAAQRRGVAHVGAVLPGKIDVLLGKAGRIYGAKAERLGVKEAIQLTKASLKQARIDVAAFPKAIARLEQSKTIPDVLRAVQEMAVFRPGAGIFGQLENVLRQGAKLPAVTPEQTAAGRAARWMRKLIPGQQTDIEARVTRALTGGGERGAEAGGEFMRKLDSYVAPAVKRLGGDSAETRKQVMQFVFGVAETPQPVIQAVRAGKVGALAAGVGPKGVPAFYKRSDAFLKLAAEKSRWLDDVDVKAAVDYVAGAMKQVGVAEKRAGITKTLLDNYMPRIMRPEAHEAVTAQARLRGIVSAEGVSRVVGRLQKGLPNAKHRGLFIVEWADEGVRKWTFYSSNPQRGDRLLAKGAQLYAVSTQEANRLSGEGAFKWLLGDYKGPLFVTDPTIAGVERILRSEKRLASTRMVQELAEFYGKTIPHNATMPGWQVPYTKGNLFRGLQMGQAKVDVAIPKWLIPETENVIGWFDDPAKSGPLLRAYDKLLGLWKGQALLGPSWPTVNMLSNQMLKLAGGFRLQDYRFRPALFHVAKLAKDFADNPKALMKALRDISFDIGGGKVVRGDRLYRFLEQNRVVDHGFWGMLKEGMESGLVTEAEKRLRMAMHPAAGRGLLGKAARVPQRILNGWYDLNSRYIENLDKMEFFLSRVSQGDSWADAAKRVKEFIFDYARATPLERSTMQRLFPFWKWVRNNTYRQLRDLVERPRYAASLPKMQNLLEVLFLDQQIPKDLLPAWLGQSAPVQVTGGSEGGVVLPLAMYTPYQEAVEVIENPLQMFARALTPAIKMPVERVFGRTIFGREVGGAPGQIGGLGHVLQQLRAPREIERIWGLAREKKVTGRAVAKALMGGRVQELQTERLLRAKAAELGERLMRVRSQLRRAMESGDVPAQQRWAAEVRLIMEERARWGLDVPRAIQGTVGGRR